MLKHIVLQIAIQLTKFNFRNGRYILTITNGVCLDLFEFGYNNMYITSTILLFLLGTVIGNALQQPILRLYIFCILVNNSHTYLINF